MKKHNSTLVIATAPNRQGAPFTGRRHQPAPRNGNIGGRRRMNSVNGGKKLR